MKNILFIFFSFIFASTAQNISIEKLETKKHYFSTFWGQDILENSYFSTHCNLYKISQTDTLTYCNNKFGKISNVETFNGLQTLVFYKENNAFVLLDAQFNETNTTIFSEINCEILQPASQNELWFFDNISQKFGLYAVSKHKIKWLTNSKPTQITHCFSDYNTLYWITSQLDCFSMNKFGKLTQHKHLEPFENIQWFNATSYIYLYNEEFFIFNTHTGEFTSFATDEKLIKNFYYKDGILTIFTDSEINTYQIKK